MKPKNIELFEWLRSKPTLFDLLSETYAPEMGNSPCVLLLCDYDIFRNWIVSPVCVLDTVSFYGKPASETILKKMAEIEQKPIYKQTTITF